MNSHKSSKRHSKSRNKKITIVIGIAIAIAIILAVTMASKNNESEKITEDISYSLENSLEITGIGSYSGPFLEDGLNETVSDVLMITLKNNGTQTLQYAELTLKYKSKTAEFAFSTLAPGEEMMVLESNQISFTKDAQKIKSANLDNVVFFAEDPSLCEDQVRISTLDGAMNIENISGVDITGRVVIYYKNFEDGMYQGGITYRAIIEDGIEAGGVKQIMTNHFSPEKSKIVFVTCGQ